MTSGQSCKKLILNQFFFIIHAVTFACGLRVLRDKKLVTYLSLVKSIEKEKLREQLLKTIQKRIDEIKNSK
jgi:hypothetical protein